MRGADGACVSSFQRGVGGRGAAIRSLVKAWDAGRPPALTAGRWTRDRGKARTARACHKGAERDPPPSAPAAAKHVSVCYGLIHAVPGTTGAGTHASRRQRPPPKSARISLADATL